MSKVGFYEASAQVIPLLLLAAAVDTGIHLALAGLLVVVVTGNLV
jgi:hypothetical protein